MANRAATIGSSDSLSGWYKELPPITKFFLTGTLVTGFCATFGIFPASVGGANCLLFNWELIRHKFHIWRLVTPFIFAGGFGLNFVFHMFICLFGTVLAVEKKYARGTAWNQLGDNQILTIKIQNPWKLGLGVRRFKKKAPDHSCDRCCFNVCAPCVCVLCV